MRINVINNIANAMTPYTNLCLSMNGSPLPGMTVYPISSILDVNKFVEDGEAEEVRLYHVVDYLPFGAFVPAMDTFAKKLSCRQGVLNIEGVDFYTVCKLVNRGELTTEQANAILRANLDNPLQMTSFNYSFDQLTSYVQSKGLKLIKSFVRGFNYSLSAERS